MRMTQFEIKRENRENNQLEAKSVKGGFPGSFWETYSAFANSNGGTILLGVRAGSGLNEICTVWEKVYHTPAILEETHKNGVDRTELTLSTGGNEQDVEAMLKLYGLEHPDQSRPEPGRKEVILDIIKENPKISRADLAIRLHIHESSAKRRLESLAREKRLRRAGLTKVVLGK